MAYSNGGVSTLTTDNLQLLNDSLSRHVREQRRSQHYRRQQPLTGSNGSPNNTAGPATATNTGNATAIVKPEGTHSSTNSSPDLSATPMSNLSSVSSYDDFQDIDDGKTSSSLNASACSTPNNRYSSSSSSLSTIVPNTNTAFSPATSSAEVAAAAAVASTPIQSAADIAATPRSFSQLGSPLLRKKSGELLKSSLRLPDLQRCQSMPNAKSVRFATNLEKVKLFEKTERPIAVSTQNSPVDMESHHPRLSWDLASSTSSSSSDEEDDDEDIMFLRQRLKPWNFTSSNVHSSFNIDQSKTVRLMRVYLDKSSLVGSIFVKNISFSKKVSIRISIDGWKSIVIIQAQFKRSVNGQFDEFVFDLNINSLNFKIYDTKLVINLCVEYEVVGSTFWDNNAGKNYQVMLEKSHHNNQKKKTSPRATRNSSRRQIHQSSPPRLDYFSSRISSAHDDFDNDESDNDGDDLFNYKLKSKSKNNRYAFDFDNKYVFNDSILQKPSLNQFGQQYKDRSTSNETIIVAKDENEDSPSQQRPILTHASHSTPNLTSLAGLTLNDGSPPTRRSSSSNFTNSDEYHKLIRNYCYAYS